MDTNKPTTLAATVDGAAKTAGVNWSIQEPTGASVTDAGVFTATTAGTYHVLATSIVDRTKNAAATVSVLTATTPPADNGGCSATSTSYAGLLPLAALLGWLLWRRRASPTTR